MHLLPEDSLPDVAEALDRSVRTPLEALRIILEDLAAGTTDHSALPGAVDSLCRVRRGVEAIEDYFHPAPPMPLTCTVREIAHGVRDWLPEHLSSHLLVALDTGAGELFVDGPMLVKCLAHLAANSIEASSSPVLLRVQKAGGGFTFSVVGHGHSSFSFKEAVQPFRTNKRGHVGLGLTLATRDVARLGGELTVRTGASRAIHFEVSVPVREHHVEAA